MTPSELGPDDWKRLYGTVAWGMGAIGVLAGIAALVVAKFRGVVGGSGKDAGESFNKFREMHSRGELTDAEFRTIKAKLAATLRQQLKDSEEPD